MNENQVFQSASAMAAIKEQAIERAIAHYFHGKPWTENDVALHALLTTDKNTRVETFSMGGFDLVEFQPVESSVSLTGHSVYLEFYQEFRELYL